MIITDKLKEAINALPEELLDGKTDIVPFGGSYFMANPKWYPMIFTGDVWKKVVCTHGKGLMEYCEPCGRVNGG